MAWLRMAVGRRTANARNTRQPPQPHPTNDNAEVHSASGACETSACPARRGVPAWDEAGTCLRGRGRLFEGAAATALARVCCHDLPGAGGTSRLRSGSVQRRRYGGVPTARAVAACNVLLCNVSL